MVDKQFYESYIYDMLKLQIQNQKKKFVLYPNGEITNLVRDILIDKYDISPVFIVDNIKFDGETVLNLEQASKKTERDMYYMVCSDRDDIYDIIRNNLKLYIKADQIIDLFPKLYDEEFKTKITDLLDLFDNEIEALEKKYVCD